MNTVKSFYSFIKNPQMYKFLIVGIGAAASVLSLTVLFTSTLQIHYTISVAISFEIVLICCFFIHDKWTFADVQKTSIKSRFIKFNIISVMGLVVNEAILIFLTNQINLHYSISESIALFVGFFFNFLVQKKISWKN